MAENKNPDYSDAATIFFQDGYRLAREFIDGGVSQTAIIQLMVSVYASIDGLIESFRNRCEREGLFVDCKRGCTFCCSQAVLASNHEILLIWHYLDKHVSAKDVEGIRSRTQIKDEATHGMTAMEFLHYIHPCPFLKDGVCLIYDVRPMACRCYLSSSMESCREQHDKPNDKTKIAALFEFPLKAGRGMNEGIRSALMEVGLVPSEWLLETFMQAVFRKDGILEEWLDGKRPFNIRNLTSEENRYLREYYIT